MNTPKPLPVPPPHPQFHDRVRFADLAFSAEALEWAERFRGMSRNTDRIFSLDLWPAARPSRALVCQAAFRTPLRANAKMVLLALVAAADADGVALYHEARMASFCGVKVSELQDALDQLAAPAAGVIVHFQQPVDWATECVTLVARPERWGWSRPRPDPGTHPAPQPLPPEAGSFAAALHRSIDNSILARAERRCAAAGDGA